MRLQRLLWLVALATLAPAAAFAQFNQAPLISTTMGGVVSGTYGYFKYISATNISGTVATLNSLGAGNINASGVVTAAGVSATSNQTSVTTLYASGNVGIGTAAPTAKLEVNGNVSATQYNGLAAASNFKQIVATVPGANGGTSTASCPTGYTILFWSIIVDHRTSSGTNGWLNGNIDCYQSGNGIVMSLTEYSGGSVNTTVSCIGICARN